MNGTEVRTVHVVYDKAGKMDVTCGEQGGCVACGCGRRIWLQGLRPRRTLVPLWAAGRGATCRTRGATVRVGVVRPGSLPGRRPASSSAARPAAPPARPAAPPPLPCAGVKEMRVLKTTQSGYEGYLKDEYTLLPETRVSTRQNGIAPRPQHPPPLPQPERPPAPQDAIAAPTHQRRPNPCILATAPARARQHRTASPPPVSSTPLLQPRWRYCCRPPAGPHRRHQRHRHLEVRLPPPGL
jgi:hypothetical protein